MRALGSSVATLLELVGLAIGTSLAAQAPPASPPQPSTSALPPLFEAPLAAWNRDASPGRLRRRARALHDPYALIDPQSLLATLRALTSIQPYSFWRNAGSEGEAQARAYVRTRLSSFLHLTRLGMAVEEQPFRTPLGGDVWQSRLELTTVPGTVEVPAQGLQGHREWLNLVLRFDSDGQPNDATPNPIVRTGQPLIVRSAVELEALSGGAAHGRIVFLDYGVIDKVIVGTTAASNLAGELLTAEPAGIVLVTTFSNTRGQSHGVFVADTSVFASLSGLPSVPILFVRIEDLEGAGIAGWTGIAAVTSARMTWDADVYSPGYSANVIARIPGIDRSRAVILGAHLDSPNTPGALDNGSGSAVLLETARVLDLAQARPPVDLVLAWFGSHERGLYGSANFVLANQELLDRTIAMLQTDCLSRPLDGIEGRLAMETWSYRRFGDAALPWPEYLRGAAGAHSAWPEPLEVNGIVSDNSSFAGHDVPGSNLILLPWTNDEVHHSGHLHDPYDTVELAAEEVGTHARMVTTAVTVALEAGEDGPDVRVTPQPVGRAVFVGSHTEQPHVSPVSFTELGMALAWEGLDVDTVPYGQALATADLVGADLVVALPIIDYPQAGVNEELYDEAWSTDEVAALEGYVAGGGLLVLTNSARRLKYLNTTYEQNEDWSDANALGARFGIAFAAGTVTGSAANIVAAHPLTSGLTTLQMASSNAVPFTVAAGRWLARTSTQPVVALVPFGAQGGEVLVLGDVGILGSSSSEGANLPFWRNLAAYARSR